MDNSYNLTMVSIVGIIAIVAIVLMIFSNADTGVTPTQSRGYMNDKNVLGRADYNNIAEEDTNTDKSITCGRTDQGYMCKSN